MNWREIDWKLTGVSILAILFSQVLHGFLFVLAISVLNRNYNETITPIIFLLVSVLAIFAGGLFLGRVLKKPQYYTWLISGVIAALWPFASHVLFGEGDWQWIMQIDVWFSFAGSIAIWYLGGWLGSMSHQKYISSKLDRNLLKWVGIGVAILIGLNIFSWATIHFSGGFRMAQKIELPLPPHVNEIPGNVGDPWVASSKRFETTVPANDESIYKFYSRYFYSPQFENVSEKFQPVVAGEWHHVQEQIRDEFLDYHAAQARWVDLTGKVLISLILHAERIDENLNWEEGFWQVKGLIYTRPYAEPIATATPAIATPADLSKTSPSAKQSINATTPEQVPTPTKRNSM